MITRTVTTDSVKPQRSFASLSVVMMLQSSRTLSTFLAVTEFMEIAVIIRQPDPLRVYNPKTHVFPHSIHPQEMKTKYINMASIKSENKLFLIAYREQ